MSTIFGTSARDSITGTVDADFIFMDDGARDTVFGLGGDDYIAFGAELNDNDQVDGGDGHDKIVLEGNYLGGLVLAATTLVNCEEIYLEDGFTYNLTLDDATAGGDRFYVNANALVTAGALILDGSAETSADLTVDSKVGDDQITTGAGDDTIRSGTGSDTVVTAAGADRIYMGDGLDLTDSIDAGDGIDAVYLSGDYSAGLTFNAALTISVENFLAFAGFDYDLTVTDDLRPAGETGIFQVMSFTTTGGDIVFDASAETDAIWILRGGLSDDTLIGGALGDEIDLSQYTGDDGLDAAFGGGGDDVVRFNDGFTRDDQVDGGAGFDVLELVGDLSAGVNFNATTLRDVEQIDLLGGFSYALTVGNNNVTADGFTVDATGVGGGQTLAYDGSAETTSDVIVRGAGSDDTISTGGGDDTIVTFAGDDVVAAGAGDDVLDLTLFLGRDDQIDGGAGFDRLLLAGNYAAGINFASTTLNGVEQVELAAGFDYAFDVGNNNVDADGFTLAGELLGSADTIDYDGSAETASDVVLRGGAGADTLIAGAGGDSIHGADGADSLTGGAGDDTIDGALGRDTIFGGLGTDQTRGGFSPTTFVFTGVAESTGPGRDWVDVLKPLKDHFDLDVAVSGVDARVNAGTLSEASFDANLAAAIGAGQLAAGHAVVFKPNAGGLSGHFFLVVDANGVAGYQAGLDYVMEFAAGSNPNAIAVGFFI